MSSDDPAVPRLPTIDASRYRSGMAQLAAAVTLVTSDGPAGRAGFTASAVTSVTDDPATLLVCMKRKGTAAPRVLANGVLCVNVLSAEQKELSTLFGTSTHGGEDRFDGVAWGRLVTGSPALQGAVAAFDCRIANILDVGTHSVLFCEVLDMVEGPTVTPLLYFRRAYRVVQ